MMIALWLLFILWVAGTITIYVIMADKPSDIICPDVFLPMLLWPVILIALLLAIATSSRE